MCLSELPVSIFSSSQSAQILRSNQLHVCKQAIIIVSCNMNCAFGRKSDLYIQPVSSCSQGMEYHHAFWLHLCLALLRRWGEYSPVLGPYHHPLPTHPLPLPGELRALPLNVCFSFAPERQINSKWSVRT